MTGIIWNHMEMLKKQMTDAKYNSGFVIKHLKGNKKLLTEVIPGKWDWEEGYEVLKDLNVDLQRLLFWLNFYIKLALLLDLKNNEELRTNAHTAFPFAEEPHLLILGRTTCGIFIYNG